MNSNIMSSSRCFYNSVDVSSLYFADFQSFKAKQLHILASKFPFLKKDQIMKKVRDMWKTYLSSTQGNDRKSARSNKKTSRKISIELFGEPSQSPSPGPATTDSCSSREICSQTSCAAKPKKKCRVTFGQVVTFGTPSVAEVEMNSLSEHEGGNKLPRCLKLQPSYSENASSTTDHYDQFSPADIYASVPGEPSPPNSVDEQSRNLSSVTFNQTKTERTAAADAQLNQEEPNSQSVRCRLPANDTPFRRGDPDVETSGSPVSSLVSENESVDEQDLTDSSTNSDLCEADVNSESSSSAGSPCIDSDRFIDLLSDCESRSPTPDLDIVSVTPDSCCSDFGCATEDKFGFCDNLLQDTSLTPSRKRCASRRYGKLEVTGVVERDGNVEIGSDEKMAEKLKCSLRKENTCAKRCQRKKLQENRTGCRRTKSKTVKPRVNRALLKEDEIQNEEPEAGGQVLTELDGRLEEQQQSGVPSKTTFQNCDLKLAANIDDDDLGMGWYDTRFVLDPDKEITCTRRRLESGGVLSQEPDPSISHAYGFENGDQNSTYDWF